MDAMPISDAREQLKDARRAAGNALSCLFDAAHLAFQKFNGPRAWFRGQSVDEPLKPKVRRPGKVRPEHMLTSRFRRMALSRYPNCPSNDRLDQWLTLMQHYGLPTRLLDWTSSVLVAAYFAVSDDKSTGSAFLWALNPQELNKRYVEQHPRGAAEHAPTIFALSDEMIRPLVKGAFTPQPAATGSVAALPDEIDLRLMVQQAAFTVHGSRKALDEEHNDERVLLKFEIPAKSKEPLRGALRTLDLHQASLFPDLDHLSRYVEDSVGRDQIVSSQRATGCGPGGGGGRRGG